MGKVTTRIRDPLPGETVFGGRGVLIPFRPSKETSPPPSVENSEAPSSRGLLPHELPLNDSPEFEAIHRKAVQELLRQDYLSSQQMLQSSPSDESSGTQNEKDPAPKV